MQQEASDARELVEQAARGDTDSCSKLLTLHVDRLSRMIVLRLDKRLQARVDAADVIQEVYLEAWRHLPDYLRNPSLPFYLWIRGLACHKLAELHRRHLGTKMRDARREISLRRPTAPETSSDVLAAQLVDSVTSPSNAAVRAEEKLRLESALSQVDSLDREVLALRHFEHLSPAETAQVLGIKEKAAGMRYVRALRRVRDVLAESPGGLSELPP